MNRSRLLLVLGVLVVGCLRVPHAMAQPDACAALPPMPSPPANARNVTEFGAKPDDDADDTEAIQRAFDRVGAGQWLVFPKGRYLHSKALWLHTRDVVLWGEGATLHATNPDSQAVLLAADGTAMYRFAFTAVTGKRLTAPWHARIGIFDRADRTEPIRNAVVRGNRVMHAGEAGSPLANSASAAGIVVYGASNFLVAENEISRSLADGIHVTGGSHDGRVVRNTVRETGDDMIGLVSYVGRGPWTDRDAQADAKTVRQAGVSRIVRNVLVAGNDLAGQYWGRGITVVGGRDITIRDNRIADTTHGAAVYLAREPSYVTYGVRNVLVEGNRISDVQTTKPAYLPRSLVRTRHAAVEIYSRLFADEARIPELVETYRIEDVLVRDNTIDGVIADGIRVSQGGGAPAMTGKRADGTPVVRALAGGEVTRIGLVDNRLSRVPNSGAAIRIAGAKEAVTGLACRDNAVAPDAEGFRHGRARTLARADGAACDAAPPKVTGAALCAR